MSDGGKGSAPRKQRDDEAYSRNWENIFGTETSKYPEERKSIETPLVVASERGPAEPGRVTGTVWKGRP